MIQRRRGNTMVSTDSTAGNDASLATSASSETGSELLSTECGSASVFSIRDSMVGSAAKSPRTP